jgi:hypothetical protein
MPQRDSAASKSPKSPNSPKYRREKPSQESQLARQISHKAELSRERKARGEIERKLEAANRQNVTNRIAAEVKHDRIKSRLLRRVGTPETGAHNEVHTHVPVAIRAQQVQQAQKAAEATVACLKHANEMTQLAETQIRAAGAKVRAAEQRALGADKRRESERRAKHIAKEITQLAETQVREADARAADARAAEQRAIDAEKRWDSELRATHHAMRELAAVHQEVVAVLESRAPADSTEHERPLVKTDGRTTGDSGGIERVEQVQQIGDLAPERGPNSTSTQLTSSPGTASFEPEVDAFGNAPASAEALQIGHVSVYNMDITAIENIPPRMERHPWNGTHPPATADTDVDSWERRPPRAAGEHKPLLPHFQGVDTRGGQAFRPKITTGCKPTPRSYAGTVRNFAGTASGSAPLRREACCGCSSYRRHPQLCSFHRLSERVSVPIMWTSLVTLLSISLMLIFVGELQTPLSIAPRWI